MKKECNDYNYSSPASESVNSAETSYFFFTLAGAGESELNEACGFARFRGGVEVLSGKSW